MAGVWAAGVVLWVAAVSGCVRDRPATLAPVWSSDGRRIIRVVQGRGGRLVVEAIELASGRASELAGGRFADPPVAAAPAPDGGTLACVFAVGTKSKRPMLRLHILDQQGSADRVRWQDASPGGRADIGWAPDGRFVVLTADRPGGWAVWQVPVAEGKARLLCDDLAEARSPTVRADGTQVAFVGRTEASGPWSLYVLTLATGRRAVVVPAVFGTHRVGYGAAWAPRGSGLAYVAERFLTAGMAEVWLWDAAAGRRRVLGTATGACIAPRWSPDATRIACVRLPLGTGRGGPGSDGRPADIVVADVTTLRTRVLVADGLANLMPSWSPDGRTLAFNTCADPADGQPVVRLVAADGDGLRPARADAYARFRLAWARHERGQRGALHEAEALLPKLQPPSARFDGHIRAARHHETLREWARGVEHAAQAAKAGAEARRPDQEQAALELLASAQMALGRPVEALATAQRLSARHKQLVERLRRGLQAVVEGEAALPKGATPEFLHRLAVAYQAYLGDPRRALVPALRLLTRHPAYPRAKDVAAVVFDCYACLGAEASSLRMLEAAAAALGDARLSSQHALLLAESSVSGGQPRTGMRWLARGDSVDEADAAWQARAATVCLRAGEQLLTRGDAAGALAAWRRAAAFRHAPLAARASLRLGQELAKGGQHAEAAPHLLAALAPQADTATLKGALRALTVARLRLDDPVAYGAARVSQLSLYGFADKAAALGEQVLGGLMSADPRRGMAQAHVAKAYERVVDYHLATGSVERAREATLRWLRVATARDLPAALSRLAACQKRAGDERARVETLSRLAIEFADHPEGAEAMRQLRLLDAPARP